MYRESVPTPATVTRPPSTLRSVAAGTPKGAIVIELPLLLRTTPETVSAMSAGPPAVVAPAVRTR
jgi:hypothetical protein